MTGSRLVLHTNVSVSAHLLPTGFLSWLRHAGRFEAIIPLSNHDTTVELIRVLCRQLCLGFGLISRRGL